MYAIIEFSYQICNVNFEAQIKNAAAIWGINGVHSFSSHRPTQTTEGHRPRLLVIPQKRF